MSGELAIMNGSPRAASRHSPPPPPRDDDPNATAQSRIEPRCRFRVRTRASLVEPGTPAWDEHRKPRPTTGPTVVAVFNSCESSAHAELACEHLEAAIGMEQSVEDEAAKDFAGQLYNSIGFGRSLQQAFDQANVQLQLATGLSGNPQLYSAPGVDPAEVFLVAPPDS